MLVGEVHRTRQCDRWNQLADLSRQLSRLVVAVRRLGFLSRPAKRAALIDAQLAALQQAIVFCTKEVHQEFLDRQNAKEDVAYLDQIIKKIA